jgi:hypothetical protein
MLPALPRRKNLSYLDIFEMAQDAPTLFRL